jgi:hypothetical protein
MAFHINDYDDDPDDNPDKKAKKNGGSDLPKPWPREDDPPVLFAKWLTELWNAADDPFTGGARYGTSGKEPIELQRGSGRTVHWDTQTLLHSSKTLQEPLIYQGIKPRKLTPYEAQIVAWAITRLCDLLADLDDTDEAREWWHSYLEQRQVRDIDRSDALALRGALADWQSVAAKYAGDPRNSEMVHILRDRDTGELLVRRGDFTDHVRRLLHSSLPWKELHGRVRELGWQLDRIQQRTPDRTGYVQARVFVIPPDRQPDDDDDV